MKRVLMVGGSAGYWAAADSLPYETAVRNAGAMPFVIASNTARASLDPLLETADGVLLMGGDDVNPQLYGESPAPETQPADSARDATEAAIIHAALERDLPLLGICRGMQMLNVHLGGSLIQHLPATGHHLRRTPDKALPAHHVAIEPDTRLAEIAGGPLTWEVNSRHHQGIARLGSGLRVAARDPEDGMIEAVEHSGQRFCLAVQWHPENQCAVDLRHARLFGVFVGAL